MNLLRCCGRSFQNFTHMEHISTSPPEKEFPRVVCGSPCIPSDTHFIAYWQAGIRNRLKETFWTKSSNVWPWALGSIPPFLILNKVNQNFPLSTVVQRQLREELLPKTRSSIVLPEPQHLQSKFYMKAYHLKVEAGEESSNCVYFYLSYFCVTWSPRRGRAIDCMNCLETYFRSARKDLSKISCLSRATPSPRFDYHRYPSHISWGNYVCNSSLLLRE